MESSPAPESTDTCRPPVPSPRDAFSSIADFGLGGALVRDARPMCRLIGMPSASASAKNGSSADDRSGFPLGHDDSSTPRSPMAFVRRISATAASIPTAGICPMPTNRSGALAQKSFASQSLYARTPARWSASSVPCMKCRIVRCGE